MSGSHLYLAHTNERFEKQSPATTDNKLESLIFGGGGGTYDDMEARVAKLEGIAEDTRKTLETIQRQLARIDTKLDSKPGFGQLYTAIFTVYGLSFTIIAAGAAVLALFR